MKSIHMPRIIFTLCGLSLTLYAASAEELRQRSVELTYSAAIEKLPADAHTVDLWLPVAQDTDGQKVSSVHVNYPEGGAIATEPRYGNAIWHKRFEAPFDKYLHDGALGAELVFHINRTEIIVPQAKSLATNPKKDTKLAAYLEPNQLIPVKSDSIDAIAASLKLANDPPIVAAHKIYDWLIDSFTYNFAAKGAGNGDVRWACDSKTGDCSDYHSTFIALCRNQGIPADHEFGFPIRIKGTQGKISTYHCWARFYVEGIGWIPIDASEADKHPELRQYNFGSQSADLFKFSHGRDVTLAPPQAGPPLNRFIYPYVEIDGKPYDAVTHTVSFKDIGE